MVSRCFLRCDICCIFWLNFSSSLTPSFPFTPVRLLFQFSSRPPSPLGFHNLVCVVLFPSSLRRYFSSTLPLFFFSRFFCFPRKILSQSAFAVLSPSSSSSSTPTTTTSTTPDLLSSAGLLHVSTPFLLSVLAVTAESAVSPASVAAAAAHFDRRLRETRLQHERGSSCVESD